MLAREMASTWRLPVRARVCSAAFAIALAWSVAGARAWGQAQPWRNESSLTATSTDALAIDGIGLASGVATVARGPLVLGVPRGSTIVSAVLYTSIRMRSDASQFTNVAGVIALDGTPVINGAGGAVIPSATVLASRCVDRVCYFTARSEVTAIVAAAYARTASTVLSIELSESGDGGLLSGTTNPGDAFAYLGHTLVVRYRNTSVIARRRFIGVWFGASDERDETLMGAVALPSLAVCNAGARRVAERDERVMVSATIASEENGCGELNDLVFTQADSSTVALQNIGGADDAIPLVPTPNCADPGRVTDLRALITTGTFGSAIGVGTSASALLFGAPEGYDGDDVSVLAPPPRRNDELARLLTVPTRVRLTQGMGSSPYKSLSVLAMQYPVDEDSDGDGHRDLAEGICERVDTDGDSNQREDWDDGDSDNDCLPDRMESNVDRTIAAPIAVSDMQCADAAAATDASTRYCDTRSSACVSCSIDCSRNAQGAACLRRSDGTLGCGCATSGDCAAGTVCAGGTCTAVVRDAGVPDASDGGASDGGAMDGGTTDGGAMDGTAGDAAGEDATARDDASGDGAAEDGAAEDGAKGDARSAEPSVAYGGGSCTCSVRGARTSDGRAGLALLGVVLALAGARRKLARRATG